MKKKLIILARAHIPEAGADQRARLVEFMAGDAREFGDELLRGAIGGGRHRRLSSRGAWLGWSFGACEGRH